MYTDESPLYKGYNRKVVNHSKKEYVNDDAYTNTIENAFGLFKRRIYGIHHQITKKHIDKYMNSFCFHFNNKDFSVAGKFENAMKMMFDKSLSYDKLIGKTVL